MALESQHSTSSDNVESDSDSLFGDSDSLFGDGDEADLSSLLNEGSSSESDPDPERLIYKPSPQPPSLPRSSVCGPTFPAPAAQPALPVVPDPLAASFSHQDGHTSGGLVVSNSQDSNDGTLAAGVAAPEGLDGSLDDVTDEELNRLFWDEIAKLDLDQHINAPTDDAQSLSLENSNDTQQGTPLDASRISLSQIHGLRYAKSRPYVHYPRRIDLDETGRKDSIWHDITLNRKFKYEDLYNWLGLSMGEGKRLNKALGDYFQGEWFVKPAEKIKAKMTHPDHTKIFLVRLAFHMLTAEKWGTTWFGPTCSTAATRTLFWPEDSTILLFYFVMLLYRVYDNVKQKLRTEDKRRKLIADTLSNSTRATSPALSDMTDSRMESCEPTAASTPAESRLPTPTPPPSEAHTLWVDTAQLIARRPPKSPKKRSRQPSEPEPEAAPNTGEAFFGALVKHVKMCKRRKIADSTILNEPAEFYDLEVPPTAKLTYFVFVKDKQGSDLSSAPAVYQHTDSMISNGAFSQLMSSFKDAEYEPAVVIQTPWGRKDIATAEDWDSAVFSIYNMRRNGGAVEVDIFV